MRTWNLTPGQCSEFAHCFVGESPRCACGETSLPADKDDRILTLECENAGLRAALELTALRIRNPVGEGHKDTLMAINKALASSPASRVDEALKAARELADALEARDALCAQESLPDLETMGAANDRLDDALAAFRKTLEGLG